MEEVYKNIVAWYTPHVQAFKACEALTALKFTLLRGMREKINTELMTEKIAEVQIMIEQIKAIYHIDEADLSRIRRRKLEEVQRKIVLDVNGKVMEGERE